MTINSVWHAVLFSVGGEPITVASVLLAVLLLALGYVTPNRARPSPPRPWRSTPCSSPSV